MKKFGNEKQAIDFAKDLIKNKKSLQFVDVFNAGSGFHSTADTNAIVAFWGDGSYTDNVSKRDAKLAAKKIQEAVEFNEEDIKSDDQFKEYAMAVLKDAFKDDFDEAKANDVIKGILGKVDGDYGAAIGMLTSSLGESVTNEATVDVDAVDPKDKNLGKLLKKHNVSMEVINKKGPSGYPEVRLTGDVKDLKVVLADGEYGWDDEDLADYIEENL